MVIRAILYLELTIFFIKIRLSLVCMRIFIRSYTFAVLLICFGLLGFCSRLCSTHYMQHYHKAVERQVICTGMTDSIQMQVRVVFVYKSDFIVSYELVLSALTLFLAHCHLCRVDLTLSYMAVVFQMSTMGFCHSYIKFKKLLNSQKDEHWADFFTAFSHPC